LSSLSTGVILETRIQGIAKVWQEQSLILIIIIIIIKELENEKLLE
jgi:hypothetical protein